MHLEDLSKIDYTIAEVQKNAYDMSIPISDIKKEDISFERVDIGSTIQFKSRIKGDNNLLVIDDSVHVSIGLKENLYGKDKTHPVPNNNLTVRSIESIPKGSTYGILDIGYEHDGDSYNKIKGFIKVIKDAFVEYYENHTRNLTDIEDPCLKYKGGIPDMREHCNNTWEYSKSFKIGDSYSTYKMVQFTLPKNARVYSTQRELNDTEILNVYNKIMGTRIFMQMPSISLTFKDDIPNKYNIKLTISHLQVFNSNAQTVVRKVDKIDFDNRMGNSKSNGSPSYSMSGLR
jgi:hypothetical protein